MMVSIRGLRNSEKPFEIGISVIESCRTELFLEFRKVGIPTCFGIPTFTFTFQMKFFPRKYIK